MGTTPLITTNNPQNIRSTKPDQARQLKPRKEPHNPRNPDNRHKYGGTTPEQGRYTRSGALHPNRRGALPTDRVQCPNKQEQTRNWHTEPLTATPLHAHLGPTGGRMGTPPTPPPALRPTPTPPTPLNAKSRETARGKERGLVAHGLTDMFGSDEAGVRSAHASRMALMIPLRG